MLDCVCSSKNGFSKPVHKILSILSTVNHLAICHKSRQGLKKLFRLTLANDPESKSRSNNSFTHAYSHNMQSLWHARSWDTHHLFF